MVRLRKVLFLILFFAFFASAAKAENNTQYNLMLGYHYFSGKDLKSLAPNTSYLMRFGAGSGTKSMFGWISSMALQFGTATANFNDSGTTRALSYQLIGGEFNLGFRIMPFASQYKLPVQPHFGVTGALQVDSFNFGTQTVSATFPKTEAQQFYGYNLFVGTDVSLGKNWGVVLQVEQSVISGTVATAVFELSGNRVFLGLFFE